MPLLLKTRLTKLLRNMVKHMMGFSGASYSPLDVKRKRENGEDFLLLDVRTPREWDTVHIEDARLLPLQEIENRIGELEDSRDKEIVVMCHHGLRSLQAQRILMSHGFSRVVNLEGGIDAYAVEADSRITRY